MQSNPYQTTKGKACSHVYLSPLGSEDVGSRRWFSMFLYFLRFTACVKPSPSSVLGCFRLGSLETAFEIKKKKIMWKWFIWKHFQEKPGRAQDWEVQRGSKQSFTEACLETEKPTSENPHWGVGWQVAGVVHTPAAIRFWILRLLPHHYSTAWRSPVLLAISVQPQASLQGQDWQLGRKVQLRMICGEAAPAGMWRIQMVLAPDWLARCGFKFLLVGLRDALDPLSLQSRHGFLLLTHMNYCSWQCFDMFYTKQGLFLCLSSHIQRRQGNDKGTGGGKSYHTQL